MSEQMTKSTKELIYKIDNIPKKDFNKILPKDYHRDDVKLAADLLEKMLKWSPK